MLCERDWVVTFYRRRSLATSDSHVVLRPMLTYPAGTTVAVADAAEVQIPLDRRLALSMLLGSRGDWRIAGVTKSALDLNAATVANARRYVFHHPAEDPREGLTLPEPRQRELASPETAAALVEDLFD